MIAGLLIVLGGVLGTSALFILFFWLLMGMLRLAILAEDYLAARHLERSVLPADMTRIPDQPASFARLPRRKSGKFAVRPSEPQGPYAA